MSSGDGVASFSDFLFRGMSNSPVAVDQTAPGNLLMEGNQAASGSDERK